MFLTTLCSETMGVTTISQGSHQTMASLLRSLAPDYKRTRLALVFFFLRPTQTQEGKNTRPHQRWRGRCPQTPTLRAPLKTRGEEALCFRATYIFFLSGFTTPHSFHQRKVTLHRGNDNVILLKWYYMTLCHTRGCKRGTQEAGVYDSGSISVKVWGGGLGVSKGELNLIRLYWLHNQ